MELRAGSLKKVTGIVITDSHNPEQDNGVKLVDPNGNMLDSQWEVWLLTFWNFVADEVQELEINDIRQFSSPKMSGQDNLLLCKLCSWPGNSQTCRTIGLAMSIFWCFQ